MPSTNWLDTPDEADYQAAQDYMTLLLGEEQAIEGLNLLKEAKPTRRKAKDILRASGHQLLPFEDPQVRRATKGGPYSPIMLFRAYPMIIAHGFDRVCAVYYMDPDVEIPCLIT